jgi:hypothetical protein
MSKPDISFDSRSMCLGRVSAESNSGLTPAAKVVPPRSRRIQQRINRERRVERGTRDLERGLAQLAGGPSEGRAARKGPQGAADRAALREQVQTLDRETHQGAAGAEPPLQGWRAFQRLSRDLPGYGGASAPGQALPRGAIVRAEVDKIDLPKKAAVFPVAAAVPELVGWRDWMLQADADLDGAEPVRAWADPALRGRRAGGGDGLERLAVRLLLAGMVVPTKRARGARGVKLLTVSKSSGAQRLVWDMRATNGTFSPPPYTALGSVSALAALEPGEPGFFAAAATDVPNFFYALEMPLGFEEFVVLEGVDLAHVRALLAQAGWDGHWPDDADSLGCRCLPMGFSWAPYLAQRVLEHVVAQAGLSGETELVHGRGQQALRRWATLCYLDDFTVIVKRAARDAAHADAQSLLGQVKAALERTGLGSHKDQAGSVLEVIGVVTDCDASAPPPDGSEPAAGSLVLRPRPDRFAVLLEATRYVLRSRKVHARALQRLVGHWAWWLQLRRPLYSILHATYPFLVDAGECARVRLPEAVRSELRLLLQLAPTVRCDLTWPVAPVVHMVDAGPEQGAVVYTTMRPAPVSSADVEPPPRHRWRLAVKRHWKREGGGPATDHNNLLEARTVLWAVARCARSGLRKSLCVIFTDSLVVLGAFSKGRSSSPSLNRLCRRFASLCVRYRLRVVLRYVPSAENYADGPSRGFRFPCVAPETRAKAGSKPLAPSVAARCVP